MRSEQVLGSRWVIYGGTAALLLVLSGWPALLDAQQVSPEERTGMLLNAARRACNDGNYTFAAEQFREFLKLASTRADIASARYGLGLCLLEGPEKDYKAAVETLTYATSTQNKDDRPFALYYLAVAERGLADQTLQQITTKAAVAQRTQADSLLRSAFTHFQAAADEFAKSVPTTRPAGEGELPVALEWSIRSRCDLAEVLIRLSRMKEAAGAVEQITTDARFAKSRYRDLALYYHGYAAFELKDYVSAGRSLTQLAPFTQADIGPHVRYLLARTHHLSGERPEAMANYQGVLDGYAAQRKNAEDALKAAGSAADKARWQAVLAAPAPDYVVRATFYQGVLLAELNRHEEAWARFSECIQQFPAAAVTGEAKLRGGVALIELKRWPEAIKVLETVSNDPQLADQALRWMAKAQALDADPSNIVINQAKPDRAKAIERQAKLAAYPASLNVPIENLRKAAERAKALAGTDPAARIRRGYILLDLGDLLRQANQRKEAAAVYALLAQSAVNPELTEQSMAREVIALQLAGQYAASDESSIRFQQAYPKSPLVAEVMARYAENALLTAAVLAPTKPDVAKSGYQEAIRRFGELLKRYPEGDYVMLARYGIATAQYELGQFAEAAKMLASIPEGSRTGELSGVAYFLADCMLRALPPESEAQDALSAARLTKQLEDIASLLNAFIIAWEGTSESVDAILKLGYCYQRSASMLAEPAEKRKVLAMARRNYATVFQQFSSHPLYPAVYFEYARTTSQLGSPASAISQLSAFQKPPLSASPLAPLAMIYLGDAMRSRGRPDDAVALLTQVRAQHEAALLKDPSRAQYVPVLQYSLAVALKESGKFGPARELLESIIKTAPKSRAAAEAPWRIVQCQKDEATAQYMAARRALSNASKPDAVTAARADLEKALGQLRVAATAMGTQAAAMADKLPDSPIPPQMNYEAAWCWRTIADTEIESARRKLLEEARAALQQRAATDGMLRLLRSARGGEVPLGEVPIQDAEKQVRARYQAIIEAAGDSRIADDARVELAEYILLRNEVDPAIGLLREVLEGEAAPEIAERLQLRLGTLYLAKNNTKSALACFEPMLQSPNIPLALYARSGAGEAKFIQQDWKGAVDLLAPFMDQQAAKRVYYVGDHALLRLGHAYARLGQWDASRAALEACIARYPQGQFVDDARYALGVALENLKNYDAAVAAYGEVSKRAAGEIAANAMFRTGLCRLAQNRPQDALRPLLTAGYAYDYPEVSDAALCEAARAMIAVNQPAQATKVLQRVVTDHPSGQWAQVARKRLAEIK